jgi:peroxiredoxin
MLRLLLYLQSKTKSNNYRIQIMKKILVLVLLLVSLQISATKSASGFMISGKVTNVVSGKVYLEKYVNLTKSFKIVDSTRVAGGKFLFKGRVSQPLLYGLALTREARPVMVFVENKPFSVEIENGKPVQVATSGSPANTLFVNNQSLVEGNKYDIDALVSAHTSSNVAAYFLLRDFSWRLSLSQLKTLRAKFTQQGSPYLTDLDELIKRLETVQVGQMAPNFTMPDVNGKNVSLTNFRGKYVLVDFWASWCPDCRAENPNVVAAYKQFKDKNFTVLGVSLDRNKESWINCIHKQGLDWTQVSTLDFWKTETAVRYGVRAIPTNVLIDPNGKIIARDVMGDNLQKMLGQVLK